MSVSGLSLEAHAQQVALKTNLLYWGTTTPNLAVEIATGESTTLDIQGSYNPFRLSGKQSNKKLRHWMVMPEWRMWACEKYEGRFLGIHGFFSSYNAGNVHLPFGIFSGLKDHRYEGHAVGVGAGYGYQWQLSPHWNIEAQFALGYAYMDHKIYECHRCGEYIRKGHKHYVGPTKIGLSFVYLIHL